MELEYLIEFATVAEENSFSKAAERMHISQSSISKHIISLEKELNVKLFYRDTHSMALTKYGEKVLSYVMPIKNMVRDMENELNIMRECDISTVKIASQMSLARYNILKLINNFKFQYPDTTISVKECLGFNSQSEMMDENVDIFFTRYVPDSDDIIEYEQFYVDKIVAAIHIDNPLSMKKCISMEELQHMTILFTKNSGILKLLKETCDGKNIDLPKVRILEVGEKIALNLMRSDNEVLLIEKCLLDEHSQKNIVPIDIEPSMNRVIYIARSRKRGMQHCARLFWKYAKEHATEA